VATINEAFGSHTALTVTNLNSLASSATAGWQSAVVDNRTTKALDYEVHVTLDMSATAPANDKAAYIYVYAAYHDGSNWQPTNNATGTEGTITITNPNNFILAKVLTYQTSDDTLKSGGFFISQCFGGRIPDGFGIVIINYTGSQVAASGNVVAYKAYTETVA